MAVFGERVLVLLDGELIHLHRLTLFELLRGAVRALKPLVLSVAAALALRACTALAAAQA